MAQHHDSVPKSFYNGMLVFTATIVGIVGGLVGIYQFASGGNNVNVTIFAPTAVERTANDSGSASNLDPVQTIPTPVPERRSTAQPTATSIPRPTNTPVPTRCPGGVPFRLNIGETAYVLIGLGKNSLNTKPSRPSFDRTSSQLALIPEGASVEVLDGPVCGTSDGITWWQVDYNGTIGWTGESEYQVYWMAPS